MVVLRENFQKSNIHLFLFPKLLKRAQNKIKICVQTNQAIGLKKHHIKVKKVCLIMENQKDVTRLNKILKDCNLSVKKFLKMRLKH